MKASLYFVPLQHRVLRNKVMISIRCFKKISNDSVGGKDVLSTEGVAWNGMRVKGF